MKLPEGRKWPWDRQAEQAAEWAAGFVRQSRWEQARADGWERSLKLWAQSYARERLRINLEPELWARPSQEEMDYWRKHACPAVETPATRAADQMSDREFLDAVADGTVELGGAMARGLRQMAQNMRAKRETPDW